MEKQQKNIIEKIIEGLCESTNEAREVQRALTREQKQAFIERHKEAIAPDSGLEKVKEAKGVKAKIAQIVENLKDGCRTASAKENQRRIDHEDMMAKVDLYVRTKKQVQAKKD